MFILSAAVVVVAVRLALAAAAVKLTYLHRSPFHQIKL
jgi:hypothetical protein